MQQWIEQVVEQFGYLGVFLLMCVENIFPPIPSELILPFGGFMTTTTSLTMFGVILSATAGSVSGALILYAIGRLMDVERMMHIVDRWGHVLKIKREDVTKADEWFDHKGYWTVFFCRMVPLIRSLISIPAGMSNMKIWLFLLLTTVGTLIWNTLLVYAGAKLGQSWDIILYYMGIYSDVIYVFIALLSSYLLYQYIKKRKSA
ncbi:DedA family protein [Bacillus sp. REN10]|uniref:DedA family protein n=1 Tax=Bacillus sp. REN10 TaxID=2782541 RepID=UPI00193B4186|nr:DedA family protein [Bacillus sp. REN10]